MSKTRIYARNLAANWIGYGTNLVLTLVLSWFAFRLLGDIRYGVWSLMVSLTGYLGMVDLGLRPALYRHFNWYLGRHEPNKVNEVLCTSVSFFVVAVAVLFVAGIVLGALFGHIFPKTPAEFLPEVRIAVVVVAVNIGFSMIAAVFGALLETHERYDLHNVLTVTVTVIRTGGTILALTLGFGLIGMALAGIVSTILACLGGYLISKRIFKEMRIRRSSVSRSMFGELIRFGIPCFFSGLGIRMIMYTSGLLIAWFIDMPSVGYYSLAMMLMEYGRTLVDKGRTVFTPEIQQSIARGDLAGLQYFVPLVTRVTMGFNVLIIVGIMFFGHEFLGLFYGSAVGATGKEVLIILGIAYLSVSASRPSVAALIGAGRVKLLAVVVLCEAVINVGLITLFVGVVGMGLRGVAIGTMIPMFLLSGVLITLIGARQIQLNPITFVLRTAGRWIPAAGLFGVACFLLGRLSGVPSWGWFFGKVGIAVVAYVPVFWLLILPDDQKSRLLEKVRKRRHVPEKADN
ncbi:MAG: oligosaccharide flippase family protein [Phycisphaerae bacterium]|nr:oligosaccharide flippase family protein [Phycisphaerae bacterium]